ncbi:hypothetical protein D3C85_1505060 [compost metagenome]
MAATAISTAERPTSECIAATSSGMPVICTVFAFQAPMAPPAAMAPMISASTGLSITMKVVATASSMPITP